MASAGQVGLLTARSRSSVPVNYPATIGTDVLLSKLTSAAERPRSLFPAILYLTTRCAIATPASAAFNAKSFYEQQERTRY